MKRTSTRPISKSGEFNLSIALGALTQMWKEDYFRLFIAHVATRKAEAHELKSNLEHYYVSCFVAHDDIEPTREWEEEIEKALRTMDALAALLSSDFHSSNWTDQEVGFAVGTGRLVLPLRFGLDPYGFIAKYQGYPIADVSRSTVAEDIVKKVRVRKPSVSHWSTGLMSFLDLSGGSKERP